jgi:hypothetical protein
MTKLAYEILRSIFLWCSSTGTVINGRWSCPHVGYELKLSLSVYISKPVIPLFGNILRLCTFHYLLDDDYRFFCTKILERTCNFKTSKLMLRWKGLVADI